jgi:hypothetical protein
VRLDWPIWVMIGVLAWKLKGLSLLPSDGCLSCQHGHDLEVLLPRLAGVIVEKAELAETWLCVWARARAEEVACPRCGRVSGRVHGRYVRRLADAAIGGRRVVIRLRVRRFFCGWPGCPAITFAEQVKGLTSRYARRSPPLQTMLAAVAVALAGRAGARLACVLGAVAGRSSMLRLIGALPDPRARQVTILGADDFAFRKGHVYGTAAGQRDGEYPCRSAPSTGRQKPSPRGCVLIRPVTPAPPMPQADAAPALLLKAGTVMRHRLLRGARSGAPQAIQVADRWHMWHHLAEHTGSGTGRGCCRRRASGAPR